MAHWRIYFVPHCDDFELQMALHGADMRARGENILVVFMNLSGNTGARAKLNGVNSTPAFSGCSYHGYTHNPDLEFYAGAPVLELEEIREARLREAVSALGGLATIPTLPGVTPGEVRYESAGLPDSFGSMPDGVDQAEAIMRDVYTRYPNSFLYTMSKSDAHDDHRACGLSLERMRASADLGPALVNSRYFVSKLYWKENQANGDYPPAVYAASRIGNTNTYSLEWYNSADVQKNLSNVSRYDELCNIIRKRMITPYAAWSPADGVYAIGRHSVNDQFENCFGTGVLIQNLMHQ